MTVVARFIGPLLGVLLLAPTLAQATDPAVTNKISSPPSQQKPPKATPAKSPKRVDQPIAAMAQPPAPASEPNLEEIVRAAQKVNAEARQIVIGNLVNATTPAYKRQIVSFATLVAGTPRDDGAGDNAKAIPASYFVGVAAAPPITDMRQGKIRHTGRELDLAIEGEGYFWVPPADDPSGREIHFTRCGRFSVDRHGYLIIHGAKRDWVLTPRVSIPDDASDIKITNDGVISLLEPGCTNRTQIGNIQVHTFAEDCELVPCGDNVVELKVKRRHGSIWTGNPGMGGNGVLRQGCLVDSNVDPQQELENLQKLEEHGRVLEQTACLLRTTSGPTSDRSKPLVPITPTEPSLQESLRVAQKANSEASQIAMANLANAITPAYKRQVVSLATIPGRTPRAGAKEQDASAIVSSNLVAAALTSPRSDMRPGNIRRTGRALDLAIEGEGFFCVQPSDCDGAPTTYYTRCGQFVVDRHGRIVLRGTKRDWILMPGVDFPEVVSRIEIKKDGSIFVTEPPDPSDPKPVHNPPTNVGNVMLHTFSPECQFVPCGDNVFVVSRKEKRNWVSRPGLGGTGILRQGWLEESNVDRQQEFESLQKLQEHAHVLEHAAHLLTLTDGPISDRTKPPPK
jgi:flagellar basal-body rod protein FlgG